MELFHSQVVSAILRKMIIRIISSMMIKMTPPMMITTRAEEEEVSAPLGSQLLSPFQRDKFVHFFYHVLDVNRCQQTTPLIRSTHRHRDHVISQEDFDDLNDRVRHYMDWSTNNMNYQTLKEVSWYLEND